MKVFHTLVRKLRRAPSHPEPVRTDNDVCDLWVREKTLEDLISAMQELRRAMSKLQKQGEEVEKLNLDRSGRVTS